MGREERRDHIMDHEGLRGLIHSFTPYYGVLLYSNCSGTNWIMGYSARWSIPGLLVVYSVFSITRCLSRNSG